MARGGPTEETPRCRGGVGGHLGRDLPSPGTHRLQQADVLPQGTNAAAEGDEEGEDADHDKQDGGVHRQAGHRRLCRGEPSLAAPQVPWHPTSRSPGDGAAPTITPSPADGHPHCGAGSGSAPLSLSWAGGGGTTDPCCPPPQAPQPHLRASATGHRPPPPPSPSRSSVENRGGGQFVSPPPQAPAPSCTGGPGCSPHGVGAAARAPEQDPLPQFPLVTRPLTPPYGPGSQRSGIMGGTEPTASGPSHLHPHQPFPVAGSWTQGRNLSKVRNFLKKKKK